MKQKQRQIYNAFVTYPFLLGFSIRIVLMVALPFLLDDGLLLQGVKYTDIDYLVFTDAARHVANGRSPFERHTYRYTPFLAWILSWADYKSEKTGVVTSIMSAWRHPRFFGRLLFCIADSICGLIILNLRRQGRRSKKQDTNIQMQHKCERQTTSQIMIWMPSAELQDAIWWLYNPLPINICTRGSAESFVVLLPVLAAVMIATSCGSLQNRSSLIYRSGMTGIIHGFTVHTKLYPIIYTASFMAYFSFTENVLHTKSAGKDGSWNELMTPVRMRTDKDDKKSAAVSSLPESRISAGPDQIKYTFPWFHPKRLSALVILWVKRLSGISSLSPMIFFFSFVLTFMTLSFMSVKHYGQISLDEGLLYHFSRVDHRHNYSKFWYWIYLSRSRVTKGALVSSLSVMGRVLLLPQIILLAYSSLGIAPYDLSFSLFVQSFVFVCQNKVITAQYFTWYLCILPLCSDRINWSCRHIVKSLIFLGVAILHWLGWAFYLEMKGISNHVGVWFASCMFFVANVNLLGVILQNYCGKSWTTTLTKKKKQ